METALVLHELKLKLASYGALRPEAWTKIVQSLANTDLKTDESFNRKVGSIAYVAKGVLKEYDAYRRKKPSIVNFIGPNNFILTTKHTESKFLKAVCPTKLVYLDFDILFLLFLDYGELKPIYDGVSAEYEDGISFRQLLLEETFAAKIQLFIVKYRPILSYLKRKDIANYLHVDYNYFIRNFSNFL